MKVLVLGATGFIGQNLVYRLLEEGNEVYCFVEYTSNYSFLRNSKAKLVIGSYENDDLLKKTIKNVDVIHHSKIDYSNLESTYELTKKVVDVCQKYSNKHLIYYSTIVVNGIVNNFLINENSPLVNEGEYELHRIRTEELISHEFGISNKNKFTIVRPGIEYGPGDKEERIFLFTTVENQTYRYIGSGRNNYMFCYIGNLVDAAILIQNNEKAFNQIFIISDLNSYTITEIISTIAKKLEIKPPNRIWSRALFKRMIFPYRVYSVLFKKDTFVKKVMLDFSKIDFTCTIKKAQNELKFKPRFDLKEGVSRTINWYRNEGLIETVKLNLEINNNNISMKKPSYRIKNYLNNFFQVLKRVDKILKSKLGGSS